MTEAVKDARGHAIQIGDIVTYVTGGRYQEIMTGEVLEVRKKIKLGNLDKLYRGNANPGETTWVDGDRGIVVEKLPFVEGRQNTREDSDVQS